jgi:hypothetical protein
MKIKSLRGRVIDMTNIMAKHGNKVAVGNAKMNAQGDKLGKNGKIVKTHQEISAEYNQAPKSVKTVALHELSGEVFSPAEVLKANPEIANPAAAKKRKIVDSE